MKAFARRRFPRIMISGFLIYVIIWASNVIMNKYSDQAYFRTDVISPDRTYNRLLREAIENCDADVLFETAPPPCKGQPFLLMLVTSPPNNLFRRNLIRRYLMSSYSSALYKYGQLWRIVFVVSKTNNHFLERKVAREIRLNGDIILGRYRDTSKNLVYKTLTGLGWAHCRCMPKYILKVHDDVFVNIRGLVQWLFRSNTSYLADKLYMGILTKWHQSKPIREKSSGLFVSTEEYPFEMYPPYAISGAYLLSRDVLEGLIPLIRQKHAFQAEDAYIGTLVQLIGVQPKETRFFHQQSRPNAWGVCSYLEVLVSLGVSAKDLPAMFSRSLRSAVECMTDKELLGSPNITDLLAIQ